MGKKLSNFILFLTVILIALVLYFIGLTLFQAVGFLVQTGGGEFSGNTEGNFILYVSDQSKAIDNVDIRIRLDGKSVIQDYYERHDGKNWKPYIFSLENGTHTIKVDSIIGDATLDEEFIVQGEGWAALAFRYSLGDALYDEEEERAFSFELLDGPLEG